MRLPVEKETLQAQRLLGGTNLLELAKAYERADWPEVTRLAERWAIPLAEVPKHYLSAVGRSDDIFAAGERTAA